jgi:hypothetical protein
MTTVSHFRDEGLGAALRSLELPEHREGFFADLEARLGTAEPRRLLRVRPSRIMVAAAASAILVLVVVAVVVTVVGSEGSSTARAANVRASVVAAIGHAKAARGRLTYTALDVRSGTRTTTRQAFVLDAAGDQRLTDLDANAVSAFDARTGVERAITTSASMGEGRFYAVRAGLAPGPPDASAASSLLQTQLGAVVRALAAGHDPRVHEVDYRGRPAWQLTVDLRPNTIYPDVDHLSVTVDRATGFPLHVLATLAGSFRSKLRLDRLELEPSLSRTTFGVRFAPGQEVLRTDAGFANVTLRQAEAIVGYRPLVPQSTPAGFRLSAVAAARRAAPTGPGEANPTSRGVASLSYRRGLEQFVVTTRLRGDGDWRDPFATAGVPVKGERVLLEGGALSGTAAEIVVDPRALPHLWAVTNRLVVTVAGDLSRSELIAVAEALR